MQMEFERIAISADFTIPDDGPPWIEIDASTTDRSITLPTIKNGVFLFLNNGSSSANLTVKNPAGTSISVLPPGTMGVFMSTFSAWRGATFTDNQLTYAAPASYSTAGAQTYTAADLLSGIIVRDPNGAGRTDVLPTAALLVAALPGSRVGDVIQTWIVNGADAAETITINAGTGGGFDANQTAASRVIPQNQSKQLNVRLTNVGSGTEAYVAYL